MDIKRIKLDDLEKERIKIGYVGEKNHVQVIIECEAFFAKYPQALAYMTMMPPVGDLYPINLTRSGSELFWNVAESDIAYAGDGVLQLTFTETRGDIEEIIKTVYGSYTVKESLEATGEAPDPIATWLAEASEALEEFGKINDLSASATTLPAGSAATAEITDVEGHKNIAIGVPRGADGQDGQDGYSPSASVSKAGKKATITITDKDGTTTAEVNDGADGQDGQDGFSPTASVSKSGGKATITITDKNGTTTAEVDDGQDGATGATPVISIGTVETLTPGSPATASMDTTDPEHPVLSMGIPEGEPGDATIDDTSTAADRVWSAKKVNDLKSAIVKTSGNFNDFTESARPYAIYAGGGTYENAPNVYPIGLLLSYKDTNGLLWQVFFEDNYTGVYTRHRSNNNVWTDWVTSGVDVLTETADLNNFTTTRTYFIAGDYPNITNLPVSSGITGLLNIVHSPGYGPVLQQYVQFSTGKLYTRIFSNNTWSSWNTYNVTLSDLFASLNLESNTDLDALLTPGMYNAIAGSFKTSTAPDGANQTGILIVVRDTRNGFYFQVFIQNSTAAVFTRLRRTNGVWDAWKRGVRLDNPALDANTNLDDLKTSGVYACIAGSFSSASAPPSQSQVGTMIVTVDTSYLITYQTFVEADTGRIYTRRHRASSGWLPWAYFNPVPSKEISILFIGNSLTQDGIAYLPYLLKNYYPEVVFKFYMWYNGGKTLAQQYEYFTNDTPCEIFSVAEGTQNWYNYNNSKKMSDILSDYTFDIVCMQDYFNFKDGYSSDSDLEDWRNCQNYIANNYEGGNGLEFITLLHAPKRDKQDDPVGDIFARTKSSCGYTLLHTIAQDMIPNGIAVYRALSTDLDNLGDAGHLSPDGTHTQEGLPCLLQTYTALCWLLDKLSINKSVYGFPFKMTTAIYNTINVPGPNLGTGVIEGTDAQNLLAQEVAIQAYKEGKQFVMNSIYSDD